MILCVSLNPAVDSYLELSSPLRTGAVNRLKAAREGAGGKAVNVARILLQYGRKVCVCGFAGGRGGKLIAETLQREGAETAFVNTEAPTRINHNVLAPDGTVTEILEPGPVITEQETAAFEQIYEGKLESAELVVISGSIPQGVPEEYYAKLIRAAKERKLPLILDSSGAALRCGLEASPTLAKPNFRELTELMDAIKPGAGERFRIADLQSAGRPSGELRDELREAVFSAAESLKERYALKLMALSLGSAGMLWLGQEKNLFAPALKLDVVNTVSCGDSAVASMAMSLADGDEDEKTLRLAVARSAACALCAESGQLELEMAEKFGQNVEITALSGKLCEQ